MHEGLIHARLHALIASAQLLGANPYWELKNVKDALLVTLAKGVHPVPSRTRQLSPSAPMVVGAQAPARVGHCQRSSFYLTRLAEGLHHVPSYRHAG